MSKRDFEPLKEGASVDSFGLKVTLGPAQDIEGDGFARDARTADGRRHRVLEFPPRATPAPLETAFTVLNVASPAGTGRKSDDARDLYLLRPAPGATLEAVLRKRDGLPLWSLHAILGLAELFQRVHEAKLLFRAVHPRYFTLAADGQVHLEYPEQLRKPGEPISGESRLFVAPELAEGGEGDARSDQFALGVLAWALLAGRLPPEPGDFPNLRIWRPDLPHGVVTAVERAVDQIPSRRHESCRAFADELRARALPRGEPMKEAKAGVFTEIGRMKKLQMPVNQDAHYVGVDTRTGRSLLLVADGVSTADVGSGDLASALMRDAARGAWEGPVGDILRQHKGAMPDDWVRAALEAILEDANARIYAFLKQPIFVGSLGPSVHPPCSTAVLAILDGDRLTVANVGDSRVYLLRDGALEQMSVDQDLRTDLLKSGRELSLAPDSAALGALTQSVGRFSFDDEGGITLKKLSPDLVTLYLRAGDRVLLCSDGVPDCLGSSAMEVMTRELGKSDDADAIAKSLCKLADEALGGDNITALVIVAR